MFIYCRAWAAFAALLICIGQSTGYAATQTIANGEYSFSVDAEPPWVEKFSVPSSWDTEATNAAGDRSWRYWLFDYQADRRKGSRVRYVDYAYEPLTSETIADAAKVTIDFFPEYQRLTIHNVELRRDGRWQSRLNPKAVTLARRESGFEHDTTTGAVTALLVLEDVRPKDVVRVNYSIEGENPILGGLDDERAVFATTSPILDSHMRVLFDADAKVSVKRLNGAPNPTDQVKHGVRELVASVHGASALRNEGSYPVWYWMTPKVVMTEQRGWGDVAKWAQALYPPPKVLPEDLQSEIARWKKLPLVESRIAAALQTVQEEVRYFGTEIGQNTHKPAEPADTWRHRYGDCKDKARLLSVILVQLGVEARPALVSAAHGKGVADLPPSAAAFDHVIVQIKLGQESLWLDPTMTQQRGVLRSYDRGDFGFALPVAAGINDLVSVPAPLAVDKVHNLERYAPKADGKMVLEVETQFSGYAAEQFRRSLHTQSRDDIERRYADFYRKRYGEVTAIRALEIQQNDSENAVLVREAYELANPWVGNTGGMRTIDTYADLIGERTTLPNTMQRTAPLAISHPSDIDQVVEISLPTGWQWKGEDASKSIDDTFVRYEKSLSKGDNIVRLSQRYRSLHDAENADSANRHLQRLRELNDLLGQRFVLAMPVQDAEKQRRERLENVMRNILDQKSGKQ